MHRCLYGNECWRVTLVGVGPVAAATSSAGGVTVHSHEVGVLLEGEAFAQKIRPAGDDRHRHFAHTRREEQPPAPDESRRICNDG